MESLETLAFEIRSLFTALKGETDPFKVYVLNCTLQEKVREYAILRKYPDASLPVIDG